MRRKEGWGVAPFEPVPVVLEPPVGHQDLMERHMQRCWRVYTIRGLQDIDEDLARYYFNWDTSSELDKANFDQLIAWCDYNHRWWT